MTSKTQHKSNVPVPDWADSYEVGDDISYFNPITDSVETAEITGFSTIYNHKGLPVIDPPEDYQGKADEVVIRKEDLREK